MAVKIPFNSSTTRENSSKAEYQIPGPGHYIDINNPIHSSVTRGILKFATDRGIMEAQGLASGPFGSTEKRFKDASYGNQDFPGPGSYIEDNSKKEEIDKIYEKIAKPRCNSQSSMFSSKTDRFISNGVGDPFIHVVGKSNKNAGKTQMRKTAYEYSDGKEQWIKQTRSPYYEKNNPGKIGFNSTDLRWKSQKQINNKSPGPGSYGETRIGTTIPFKKKRVGASNHNRSESYRPKTGTSEKIGPGCYSVEKSMIKRSFNMSLDNSFPYS